MFLPTTATETTLDIGPFDTVIFGPWPLALFTKFLIPPFGSGLATPDLRLGMSTLTVKLKSIAGGFTGTPLFRKQSTATNPMAFAATWEKFPFQILVLYKFPCSVCTKTSSVLRNCKFPGLSVPGCAVETPQKCTQW